MYEGCTRNAYHLYMLRYNPEAFEGLSRNKFLKALDAEEIACYGGYTPIEWRKFVPAVLTHERSPESLLERGYCRLG